MRFLPEEVARVHDVILAHFTAGQPEADLVIPYDKSALIGEVHAKAAVLAESFEDDGVHVRVRAPEGQIERWRQAVGEA